MLSSATALDVLLEAAGDKSQFPYPLPWSRWTNLPAFWRDAGFTTGAEIGVEQGRYAKTLLEAMPDLHLTCVDAWKAYRGYREHVTQSKLDGFYLDTQQRLQPYASRVTVIRAMSLEAAATVTDGSLDFVFIDGNHELSHVMADICAWAPKVKPGGIVSGHDYRLDKGKAGAVFHVPYAVQAYTQAYQISPWFVMRGDQSPSWLWVQGG